MRYRTAIQKRTLCHWRLYNDSPKTVASIAIYTLDAARGANSFTLHKRVKLNTQRPVDG